MKATLAVCLLFSVAIFGLSGCSLVTVPVKAAGSIVTTTVGTTGDIVTAPFDAVSGRERRRDKEKKEKEAKDKKKAEEANRNYQNGGYPAPGAYPATGGYYPPPQQVQQ